MKKYTSPKIKAVTLDPDQAVLEVCAIGGLYVSALTISPFCNTAPNVIGPAYLVTPKGATGGSTRFLGNRNSLPS